MRDWLTKLWRKLKATGRPRALGREIADELRLHRELREEKFTRSDGSEHADDAGAKARPRFASELLAREATREMWLFAWLENFGADLRYAGRMLRKSPAFTAAAVIALALGIGANTAVFSVVNAVLLHALPYRDADRIVWATNYLPRSAQHLVFDADYFAWRRQSHMFEEMAAYSNFGEFTLTGAGEPVRVAAPRVTSSFFRVMDITPAIGREFSAADDKQGATRVAILGDKLWRERFSANPATVGKTISLDGNPYLVVGILPARFEFPANGRMDLLVPYTLNDRPVRVSQSIFYVQVLARLRPYVSLAGATADLSAVDEALHAGFPGGYAKMVAGARAQVMTLHDHLVGNVRPALLILLGAIGLVLLIACANVANLQLARAVARERELAIRGALGAGRSRIARQLLTENVLLGIVGGGAGLALATWLVDIVRRFGPHDLPHLVDARLDWRVLAFTLGVSLVTGVLFGVAPLLAAFRTPAGDALKEGGSREGLGQRARRSQQALMVAEMAVALVLFVGAGLLARSFVRLISIPRGFDGHNVLIAEVSLPLASYPKQERQHELWGRLLERLRAMPGVLDAGAVGVLPTQGFVMASAVEVEGRPPSQKVGDNSSTTTIDLITPGYFSTLRIPVLEGRALDWHDAPGAPLACNVNDAFARRFFPKGDAIGSRIDFADSGSRWWTIVGVVGDTRQALLEEPHAEIFATDQQGPVLQQTLVIRAAGDPSRLAPAVRAELAALDGEVPLFGVMTLEEMMARNTAPQRFNAFLLGTFAALAVLLAAVGIYGVMAYAVGERTREIGIRMALGAERSEVLRMILAQGMRFALLGIALGLGGAFAVTRLLGKMLYGVKTTDPATFAGVALTLLAVALIGCAVPARRAMKVDPMVALRYE